MANELVPSAGMGRRVTADDVIGQPLQVFDSRGLAIGKVRAFQEIPGGLRVWIYASSPDGNLIAGVTGDDLAEFVADLAGAYVGRPDAR